MPSDAGPGQQPTPKASNAMPATRATTAETPARAAPSSNRPTSAGATINATPVAASATPVRISSFFIARPEVSAPVLIVHVGTNFGGLLPIIHAQLLWAELKRQFVNRPVEPERTVVVIFDEGNRRAGVKPHVKGLVFREHDGCGVLQGFHGDPITIHRQLAAAAFPQARSVNFEVERDGVFPGFEFRAFPRGALQAEQVVEKHHMALAEAQFTLAQEQAVAAEPSTLGGNHALRTAFGDGDFRLDHVGAVQDVRRAGRRHTAQFARVSEGGPASGRTRTRRHETG